MSAFLQVTARYPKAFAQEEAIIPRYRAAGTFFLIRDGDGGVLAQGRTAVEAWEAAARRIRERKAW